MASSRSAPRPFYYVAGFLLFSAFVIATGYRSYTTQRDTLDATWRTQLAELASLTAGQVASWRGERLADAAVAAQAATLMPAMGRMLHAVETAADRASLLGWLDGIRTNYNYKYVILVDGAGGLRLASGAVPEGLPGLAAIARATLASTAPLLHDSADLPGLAVSHFVLGTAIAEAAVPPAGVLLMGIDPQQSLFPVAMRFPAGRDGVHVLVRQSGDATTPISPLRHNGPDHGDALVTDERNAVIQAARADGAQHAGDAVLASSRAVPDSAWLVVATLSRSEAFAPLQETLWRLFEIAGTLMLLAVAAAALAWRQQRSMYDLHRREADIERRALAGHYEFLTRFGNDAILLLDGQGGLVDVNDRAIEQFGYSRDELMTLSIGDLRAPGDAPEIREVFEVLRARDSHVFEATYRRKDGSLVPMETSARRIEVGGKEFFQGFMRDISERRRADAQIRHLNRLYAVLSECSRCIVSSRTQADLFDSVCRIAADVGRFRLASVSLIGDDQVTLRPAARAGEASEYRTRIALATTGPLGRGAAGRAVAERRPVICNDFLNDPTMAPWREEAARFGMRSSIALPLRMNGREIGVLGLYSGEVGFFDDAEARLASEVADSVSFALDSIEQGRRREEAAAELRASRDRLERVLDVIDEGYWDWRPATGELHLSNRYHTMLGYLPGELAFDWEAHLTRIHPEDAPAARETVRQFRETQADSLTLEYRIRCKSGAYVWLLSRTKVIERDASGAAGRTIGTYTDITERRKLEEQFVQAQKLESVGRLAGGVAHDFNNLLTVVNGYSEMVLWRLPAGDPNWAHIDAIHQAGVRAAALTQQLLAFSRKQPTQPQVVRLNAAVTDFSQLLRRLVGEDIELILRLDAADDCVLTDPSQLHQVIMNLVVNARDAMPGGGRLFLHTTGTVVEPAAAVDAEPGPYVVLSVTDTGIGMDEQTRTQIFEPFFTTKERGKGTGLGLSMVYGAVRQSGGFVRVESEVGKGTTFAIHWPQSAPDAESTMPTVAAPAIRGSEVVLVVEDEPSVRELAVEMLRALGYTPLTADDAAAAIALAEIHDGPIDVLVTDMVMPGLDGRAVAERIRRRRPDIKVIFASGYAGDVMGMRGAADDEAFLPKPYAMAALGGKIREVLDTTVPAPVAPPVRRRAILVADDDPGVCSFLSECLSREYRVLQARNGAEAMAIIRREPDLELLITDIFMPNQEGVETIQAARELRPGLRIIAMSGAFGGRFLEAADRVRVEATLPKPISVGVLRQAVADALAAPSGIS